MKILLAIDSSKGSQIALDEAAARPWPAGTEFLVLNAVAIHAKCSVEVIRPSQVIQAERTK